METAIQPVTGRRNRHFHELPNSPLSTVALQLSSIATTRNGYMTEEQAKEVARIYERATNEMLGVLQTKTAAETPAKTQDWMTAIQLAEYWQLLNDKNEPTTAGILKWVRRPPDQSPLPHAYMGDLLRFNRKEVDLWAKEEAERRRVQKEKRQLRIA
jgi:hypothetical protein